MGTLQARAKNNPRFRHEWPSKLRGIINELQSAVADHSVSLYKNISTIDVPSTKDRSTEFAVDCALCTCILHVIPVPSTRSVLTTVQDHIGIAAHEFRNSIPFISSWWNIVITYPPTICVAKHADIVTLLWILAFMAYHGHRLVRNKAGV